MEYRIGKLSTAFFSVLATQNVYNCLHYTDITPLIAQPTSDKPFAISSCYSVDTMFDRTCKLVWRHTQCHYMSQIPTIQWLKAFIKVWDENESRPQPTFLPDMEGFFNMVNLERIYQDFIEQRQLPADMSAEELYFCLSNNLDLNHLN